MNEKNIIFEGWYDKRLFKIALSDLRRGFASLRTAFQDVGLSHCNGVKHIKNVTPVFEFTNRKCIIVSDADKMAREKQREYKKQKGYGIWKRYDEIDDACTAVTGEDFIKNNLINQAIEVIKKRHTGLTQAPTLSNPKGKIFAIETWLKACGLNKSDQVKSVVNEIKEFVFEKATPSDVETSYYQFLNKLAQQLQ